MSTVKEMVERIVEDGVMTHAEHEQLMDMIHKDGQIDPDESAAISRIFGLIREGKLKVIDEVRESFHKDEEQDKD